MKISTPLVFLLGLFLLISKRKSWTQSYRSARSWLQGQWMMRVIKPDRRRLFVGMLLNWWRMRWQYDLIHIQGYTSDLLFVIDWAYSKKIPVIYEEHQTPDAQFNWWKDFNKSINKATVVVAVSEKSAQGLWEVAGVTQPIVVAYYTVPDPFEASWRVASRVPNSDGIIRITTPARLYVTKGLTYLLEAIVKVQSRHPNVQFKVYGDGPLRDELLGYAEKLGLEGNKIFSAAYTSRKELAQIMAQTDIFVMSSILEGLPLALIEAMSYGCPVVVTSVGGIPEAIQDGVNGLLCEPRDAECLAAKIIALIENPSLRQTLGQAARKTYEQGPFTPQFACDHFISIYRDVLGERKQANIAVHPA